MRIANGIDVYDDDTDEWLRFDTESEAEAYANPPAEPEPKQVVVDRPASLRTFAMVVSTTRIQVLDSDTQRDRVLLFADGGDVIIGNSQVQASNGFMVANGTVIELKSSAELYAVVASVTATLRVLVESYGA